MVNTANFFDLYDVFINELIGDVNIAIIIGIVLIAYFCSKNNFPNSITIIFIVLFLSIMFSETMIWLIWAYVVLFVGTMFYFYISRGINKN